MPQIAQILVLTFKIFQGSMPPDPPRNFLFFFHEQFQALHTHTHIQTQNQTHSNKKIRERDRQREREHIIKSKTFAFENL